jgi:RNase P subunit RPR2
MSYDCVCDYDQQPRFYNCVIRTARKPHICDECGGPILPGDKYEFVSGRWEYVYTFKTCERCRDIRVWTKNNVPCLCWAHGNMIDDCKKAVSEAWYRAKDETVGLRFGLLRRIVARDKFNQARLEQQKAEV